MNIYRRESRINYPELSSLAACTLWQSSSGSPSLFLATRDRSYSFDTTFAKYTNFLSRTHGTVSKTRSNHVRITCPCVSVRKYSSKQLMDTVFLSYFNCFSIRTLIHKRPEPIVFFCPRSISGNTVKGDSSIRHKRELR